MNLQSAPDLDNPKKLTLSFRGVFFRRVDRFLFQKELKGKDFPTFEAFREWFWALEIKLARKTALFLLARRHYPRGALLQKLREKGFCDGCILPLLDYLQKEGMIDESYFLEKEVERWARKGFGPLLIRYKLQNKGFDKELLLKTMAKLLSEETQLSAIRSLLARKKNLDKKKMASLLSRRGYPASLIQRALF